MLTPSVDYSSEEQSEDEDSNEESEEDESESGSGEDDDSEDSDDDSDEDEEGAGTQGLQRGPFESIMDDMDDLNYRLASVFPNYSNSTNKDHRSSSRLVKSSSRVDFKKLKKKDSNKTLKNNQSKVSSKKNKDSKLQTAPGHKKEKSFASAFSAFLQKKVAQRRKEEAEKKREEAERAAQGGDDDKDGEVVEEEKKSSLRKSPTGTSNRALRKLRSMAGHADHSSRYEMIKALKEKKQAEIRESQRDRDNEEDQDKDEGDQEEEGYEEHQNTQQTKRDYRLGPGVSQRPVDDYFQKIYHPSMNRSASNLYKSRPRLKSNPFRVFSLFLCNSFCVVVSDQRRTEGYYAGGGEGRFLKGAGRSRSRKRMKARKDFSNWTRRPDHDKIMTAMKVLTKKGV